MAVSWAELRHWLIQQPEGTQPPARLGGGQGVDFKAFSDPAGSARESPAQGIPSARLAACRAVPGCQGIPLHSGRSSHLPLWSRVAHQLCVVSLIAIKFSFLALSACAHTQNSETRKTGERGNFSLLGFGKALHWWLVMHSLNCLAESLKKN